MSLIKHILLLIPACVISLSSLSAQNNAAISGIIRDDENGETLIGATVEAIGLRKGNVSNEYGFYSFSVPVSKDSITLKFSYLGYQTQLRRILPTRNVKLDISLNPEGSVLGKRSVIELYKESNTENHKDDSNKKKNTSRSS